jgi:hypothetical protein
VCDGAKKQCAKKASLARASIWLEGEQKGEDENEDEGMDPILANMRNPPHQESRIHCNYCDARNITCQVRQRDTITCDIASASSEGERCSASKTRLDARKKGSAWTN